MAFAGQWGLVVTSIFFIVDPLGVVPIFLALTEGMSKQDRRKIALRTSITVFAVLAVFATAGGGIMRVFGFTIDAFKIAGGILLFNVAVDMMRAQRPREKGSKEESIEEREDISIVPLAVPMLSGPVAITTVMMHASNVNKWYIDFPMLYLAIFIVSGSIFLILVNATNILAKLGETVLKVLTRIMGLLLVVMAVQFCLDGFAGYVKILAKELTVFFP